MWTVAEALKTTRLEAGLARACLALGRICADEASRADALELRVALVKHAIAFLDTACTLLPGRDGPAIVDAGDPRGRNLRPAEEGDELQGV